MNKSLALVLIIAIVAILLVSGCTSSGRSSSSPSTYRSYEPPCDREAAAHRAADRALEYCRGNPYGTYRGSVCGIPVKIVC